MHPARDSKDGLGYYKVSRSKSGIDMVTQGLESMDALDIFPYEEAELDLFQPGTEPEAEANQEMGASSF